MTQIDDRALTRRRLLRTALTLPLAALATACELTVPGQGPPPVLYRLTPKSTFSVTGASGVVVICFSAATGSAFLITVVTLAGRLRPPPSSIVAVIVTSSWGVPVGSSSRY